MKGDGAYMERRVVEWLFGWIPLLCLLVAVVGIPGVIRLYQVLSGKPSEPAPPDLSQCTRIEIQYEPSILEYHFGGADEKSLLTADEELYLGSLRSFVTEDPEDIKALAHDLSLGWYEGPVSRARPQAIYYVRVTCYRDSKPSTSFIIGSYGSRVETDDGHSFEFPGGRASRSLYRLRPEVRRFEWRVSCANGLRSLWQRLHGLPGKKGLYPVPSEWCDTVMQALRTLNRPDSRPKYALVCPSAREGRCHYAMNPNCEPNSPPDRVLLFETKAGWNQHGGPELFTFGNHDPRGGCVLFNDGSVKFIRTEEELSHLRWE